MYHFKDLKEHVIFWGSHVEICCHLAGKPRFSHKNVPQLWRVSLWPEVPSWRAWNVELKTIDNGWKKCSTTSKNGLEVDESGWCVARMAASIVVRQCGFQWLLISGFWFDWCGAYDERRLRRCWTEIAMAVGKEKKKKQKKKEEEAEAWEEKGRNFWANRELGILNF